jgi:hypothetical protein
LEENPMHPWDKLICYQLTCLPKHTKGTWYTHHLQHYRQLSLSALFWQIQPAVLLIWKIIFPRFPMLFNWCVPVTPR